MRIARATDLVHASALLRDPLPEREQFQVAVAASSSTASASLVDTGAAAVSSDAMQC